MATAPDCFDDAPLVARDVARGVARLLYRQDLVALCEVPLGNGRRADLMALDAKGCVTIVEIKVSRGDLRGDRKWPDYLDYCDRFLWAVPVGFDLAPFEEDAFMPDRAGLIVADRYDAEMLRPPALHPLAPARRRVETLRFARVAARRQLAAIDAGLGAEEPG